MILALNYTDFNMIAKRKERKMKKNFLKTILLPSKSLTMSDKPIVIGMYQYFFGPSSNNFALYGAYQHATSSVTFD